MVLLVLGLVLFLGLHSVRMVAGGWRDRQIAQRGEGPWKGAYSLLALLGLTLIVWGYGEARQQPVALWAPSTAARHLAIPLTLLSFILQAAPYVPGNAFKARLGHPLVAGVFVWALAHLLANHTLADALLFGGFALWSGVLFFAARARDRAAGLTPAPATLRGTLLTLAAGVGSWALFVFWLHGALTGIRPLG